MQENSGQRNTQINNNIHVKQPRTAYTNKATEPRTVRHTIDSQDPQAFVSHRIVFILI